MKVPAILFLFAALLLPSVATAQWISLTTGTTQSLSKIEFASDMTGYAIGPNTILRTTDAGQHWTALTLPGESLNLKDLDLLEDGTLFFSASSPFKTKVYRSRDMGATWTDVSPDSAPGNWWSTLFVRFFSQNSGFLIMGTTIWRTSDGGSTWSSRELPAVYEVKAVDVIDSMNIRLGGWDGTFAYKGILLTTANGGESWDSTVVDRAFDFDRIIGSISFISRDTGFAATTWGMFLTTSDGGRSWQTDSLAKIQHPGSTLSTPHDMIMLDRNNGYWLSEQTIYRTNNGGTNWTPEYTSALPLSDLSLQGNSLYAAGDSGLILKKSLVTGVEEKSGDEISIIADPAQDGFRIGSRDEPAGAAIYGLDGTLFRSSSAQEAGEELHISTAGLPSGAYFLRVRSANRTAIRKFTIVR